ncbi:MAG: ABC transporter ATP-binding protein [Rhodobacteraceae bacterium]|nr:MAG: ABC transporter ATP-binding protein [Paracoccaceae bacterium]
MTEILLDVRDLTVAFGTSRAVEGLSYQLARGETLAVVGESGSGKSVSSLALLGLLPPRAAQVLSGQAMFGGTDLLSLNDAELRRIRGRRISMIFQEPMTSLTPVLRLGQQLTEGLIVQEGLSARVAHSRACEMLERVGLDAPERRMRQYPHQLSGGQRQRVMIAMAMLVQPEILIADEATTALDVTVQGQILDLIRDLQAEFGMSVLMITHDMGVVAEMGDRVLVMHRGQKVEDGHVSDVLARPRAPYTQGLLEAVPRLGAGAALRSAPRDTAERRVILRADGLRKSFARRNWLGKTQAETHALDDVSFDLCAGETLALVGESGSGKSTTGRAVLGLMPLDAGRVMIEGRDLRDFSGSALRQARRHMQMIFQDPFASLNPRLSAARLVGEPLVIHGLARGQELTDRVADLFRRVGLDHGHMTRYPHEFSGGQRQRLSIARALATGPRFIVADEPTSALDVSIQAQILDLMRGLQQDLGLAYLFISHDLAVVERLAHRVAVMRAGRIVELGPTDQVLHAARHPYTQQLIAAVPVPDPALRRNRSALAYDGEMPMGPLTHVAPDHLVAQ